MTLVIPLVLEPDGSLVQGEVIRVPHRSGPAFRTWDQLLELARQEARRDLHPVHADNPVPPD